MTLYGLYDLARVASRMPAVLSTSISDVKMSPDMMVLLYHVSHLFPRGKSEIHHETWTTENRRVTLGRERGCWCGMGQVLPG